MPKKQKKNDLETLIEENIKKTNLLIKQMELLEKEFKRFQTVNLIRFFIVAIPVILAVLYLIPLFREFVNIYQPILDSLDQFNTFKNVL